MARYVVKQVLSMQQHQSQALTTGGVQKGAFERRVVSHENDA